MAGAWSACDHVEGGETRSPGDERPSFERLRALGYAAVAEDEEANVGVVLHERSRAAQGWNVYTSGHAPEVVAMDMDGQVLHTWGATWEQAFPYVPRPHGDGADFYRRVHLLPGGHVLVLFEGQGLVRLDSDSNILWGLPNGAHQDVHPNGDIYVLTREARHTAEDAILEDFVVVLGQDGREKGRVSLLECLRNSRYRSFWDEQREQGFPRALVPGSGGDLLHANALTVLTESSAGGGPGRAGHVLTSFRRLSALATVDLQQVEVSWLHAGDYRGQHDPQPIGEDALLVFDNFGDGGRSRVVEYDWSTMEPVWEYRGTSSRPFFSRHCGSAQRLPNGNTLITESSRGQAFEILPDGTRVWEYHNPDEVPANPGVRARLFGMTRVFEPPPGARR